MTITQAFRRHWLFICNIFRKCERMQCLSVYRIIIHSLLYDSNRIIIQFCFWCRYSAGAAAAVAAAVATAVSNNVKWENPWLPIPDIDI